MGAAAIPVAIGLQVAGSVYSAKNAELAGRAQAGMYRYTAQQARDQADLTELAGQRQAHDIQTGAAFEYSRLVRKQHEVVGAQVAGAAAQGISGSVTAEDIARDTGERSRLDQMVLRFNADTQADETIKQAGLTAFNLRSEAAGYDTAAGEAERAGKRQATATLLGGAASIAGTVASGGFGSKVPPGPGRSAGPQSTSLAGNPVRFGVARPY